MTSLDQRFVDASRRARELLHEVSALQYADSNHAQLAQLAACVDHVACATLALAQDLQRTAPAATSPDPALLAADIASLDLPLYAYHALLNANVKTIGELVQKTESQLRCVKNFGPSAVKYAQRALSRVGLQLATMKVEEELSRAANMARASQDLFDALVALREHTHVPSRERDEDWVLDGDRVEAKVEAALKKARGEA